MKKLLLVLFVGSFVVGCTDEHTQPSNTSQVVEVPAIEQINSADCSTIIQTLSDAVNSTLDVWKLNSAGISRTESNSNDYAAYLFAKFLAKKHYTKNDLNICMNQYQDIMLGRFNRDTRIRSSTIIYMVINDNFESNFKNGALDFVVQTYK
jgi:hypothetical protein